MFGAAYTYFHIEKQLIVFIFCMKTHKDYQRQGMATEFLRDIEYAASVAATDLKSTAAHIVLGIPFSVKSVHKFYSKRGFSKKLPPQLESWSQMGSTLMYKKVEKGTLTHIKEDEKTHLEQLLENAVLFQLVYSIGNAKKAHSERRKKERIDSKLTFQYQ